MAYLSIWIDMVWSTKNREPLMDSVELRQKIFDHISTNSRMKGIELDSINGGYDHAHALISLRADQTIAKIAQLLKGESSHWVNEQRGVETQLDLDCLPRAEARGNNMLEEPKYLPRIHAAEN